MSNRENSNANRQLYLMLPMYNEETSIIALLENVNRVRKLLKDPFEVVIVDDGSKDNSVNNVKRYSSQHPDFKIKIIPHEKNMGLGQAMRTGIYYLTKTANDNDIIFTMDADNTHNPEYMPDMIEKIEEGNEIVIASRYCGGGDEKGLKLHRKILSRGASGLLSLFFNCKGVRDYTCGYRAYKGTLLKQAYNIYGEKLICENGFTCMAELLIKVHPFASNADEVPMVLRYDLKTGASKMKILKTIIRYFHLINSLKKVV